MVNFAAADVDGLTGIVKRRLKKLHYPPHLIDGCLAGAGHAGEARRGFVPPRRVGHPRRSGGAAPAGAASAA
jgi:hypothetical protein